MKRIGFALVAIMMGAFIQQASAADMPGSAPLLRAPSAVIATRWEGLYVGGHAGYAWANGGYVLNDGIAERFGIDAGGFTGGGQMGAQVQWGQWVAGIEGSYSWTDINETVASTAVAGKSAALDIRQIGTIAGRLGWTAGDRWMVYGKGGVAFARIHTLDLTPAGTFDSRVWETGYVLGLGVEYMWAPNWIVGAELDYYGLTFNRQMAPASIYDSNADVVALMLRVNYLFSARW